MNTLSSCTKIYIQCQKYFKPCDVLIKGRNVKIKQQCETQCFKVYAEKDDLRRRFDCICHLNDVNKFSFSGKIQRKSYKIK